jgi:glycosyltransferase involved in cell wall biosynthesis
MRRPGDTPVGMEVGAIAMAQISVIIPANNEADYIGACLEALLVQQAPVGGADLDVEIIVAANACLDATAAIARGYAPRAEARGWRMIILDLAEGGKPNALNQGDAVATGDVRVFLDADVVMRPQLLGELRGMLENRAEPGYASGRLVVAPARSWVTRSYARIWSRLPFTTDCVPGAGLFAVNAAGRRRWGAFPAIISDDTFVRLNFRPEERLGAPAVYVWPMVEGFANLVRVRRRQNIGVEEVAQLYPELMANDDKPPMTFSRLVRLIARDPIGFGVYAAVAFTVHLPRRQVGERWSRGR